MTHKKSFYIIFMDVIRTLHKNERIKLRNFVNQDSCADEQLATELQPEYIIKKLITSLITHLNRNQWKAVNFHP